METGIPGLSESGGSIEDIVRAEQPFDAYFCSDEGNFEQYDTCIKGDEPEETPSGKNGSCTAHTASVSPSRSTLTNSRSLILYLSPGATWN